MISVLLEIFWFVVKMKSRYYKVSDISLIRNILVCGEDEKQVLLGE